MEPFGIRFFNPPRLPIGMPSTLRLPRFDFATATAPATPAKAAPPARRAPFAPDAVPATSFAPEDTLSLAVPTTPLLLCFARGRDLLLLAEPELLLLEFERDLLLLLALGRDVAFALVEPDGFPFVRFDELLLRRFVPELPDLRPPFVFVWGISLPPPSPFALPPGGRYPPCRGLNRLLGIVRLRTGRGGDRGGLERFVETTTGGLFGGRPRVFPPAAGGAGGGGATPGGGFKLRGPAND